MVQRFFIRRTTTNCDGSACHSLGMNARLQNVSIDRKLLRQYARQLLLMVKRD